MTAGWGDRGRSYWSFTTAVKVREPPAETEEEAGVMLRLVATSGAPATLIAVEEVAVAPAESVTVSVMTRRPGAVNVWAGVTPVPAVPSPKSQA